MAKQKGMRSDGLEDDLRVSAPKKEKTKVKKAKKPWSLRKKIIVAAACTVAAAVLGVVLYYASILLDPLSGFNDDPQQTTSTSSPIATGTLKPGETPTATPDPYDELLAQADFGILSEKYLNILLIGVDHGEERDDPSWNGKKDFHSDVMIILSINKETNEVNMISLPRDTYAKIPGVEGIYKLNLSLNCGGGWPSEENNYSQAGFDKVCQAASWMIGGIPIQYYYAVDFGAVKGLVDAVGGVDFDMDIGFTINGRTYEKGLQHLDGQGALDYMRVRKKDNIENPTGETGDLHRINRQKAMLVAIYKQMMQTGTLFKIPQILDAFEGNLYTNVDLRSTAGLAAYAYQHINPDSIKVWSMDGPYGYYIFNYHFVLTDLNKRVDIIKNVYGIDISTDPQYKDYYKEYQKYTQYYAWDYWYDMQTEVATEKTRPLLDQMKQLLEADALLPPYPTPEPVQTPDPLATPDPSATTTTTPSPTPIPSEGYQKYGADVIAMYERAEAGYTAMLEWSKSPSKANNAERLALITQFKADFQALCTTFAITIPEAATASTPAKAWENFWKVIYADARKVNQDIIKNEILIDFN